MQGQALLLSVRSVGADQRAKVDVLSDAEGGDAKEGWMHSGKIRRAALLRI